MSHPILFAKTLALLVEEVQTAANLTMVRSGLLRLRQCARLHPLTLDLTHGRLTVNGARLPRPIIALTRFAATMQAHGVGQLTISAGAVPRELLKLAVLLARQATATSGAPTIFEALRDAALWSIQVYPFTRVDQPVLGSAHGSDVALEEPAVIAARVQTHCITIAAAAAAGDVRALALTLAALVAVEGAVASPVLRPYWTAAVDGEGTPEVVRTLIDALPTADHTHGATMQVLRRMAQKATPILIDALLQSTSLDVRRACFDALTEVRRGTGAMERMLLHEHWFVVRNAACLLGALGARPSEPELTVALGHADERVRAAVVSALLQLDTPTSRARVRATITDSSAEVRRRAVRAFLTDEDGVTSSARTLMQALGREPELEVQVEFVYAIGTLATPDAVQQLIRLCAGDGRSRPAEFRIAAAEALTSARMTAALPLLRAMQHDADADVRAAARHLIRTVS